MSLTSDLIDGLDDILGLRDEIGAIKHHVYILTRTWSGSERGDGTATDVVNQMLPTPYVIDYSHNMRLREGGTIKEGDIVLKMISKESYPNESDIDCTVSSNKVEKFYKINNRFYEIVSVVEEYIYWNVHLRKTGKA